MKRLPSISKLDIELIIVKLILKVSIRVIIDPLKA